MTLSSTIWANIELAVVFCYTCGTPVGIDRTAWFNLEKCGGSFWCHRGHKCTTGEGSMEKELREAKEQRDRYKQFLSNERSAHEITTNQLRAQKAAKTRLKNRISKGVCPCCNRSFANLAAHMRTEHPDYTAEETES